MASILPGIYSEENQAKPKIVKFFDQYKIGNLLRQSNFGKESGIPGALAAAYQCANKI